MIGDSLSPIKDRNMLEFDMIQCGLIVLFIMAAGEVIAHKMGAVIPAILASALLYLALLWCGIIPRTLVQDSGLTHLTSIAMMFMILSMGTSIRPKELMDNWRVVLLAAVSYVGQTAITLLVIGMLFGRNMALGSLPGGSAVALIVRERAGALGYDQVVLLSVILLAVQSLVACPIASAMMKREIKRLQTEGDFASEKEGQEESEQKTKRQEGSPYQALLRFYAAAWAAGRLELLTGISRYVFCLILGVFFTKIGFLHKDEMEQAKSRGLIMLMMMTMVLDGFSSATPELFVSLMTPVLCVLTVEVLSIFLVSGFVGRLLGFGREMSFALCLNVMIGFPLNLMLAQDLIRFLVTDSRQQEVLDQKIASKMVIAGFTSVTFLSTVGAGILVGLMR